MIKNIISQPVGKRQYTDAWGITGAQYEFLVTLEDDTEVTVWIDEQNVRQFIKGKWNKE